MNAIGKYLAKSDFDIVLLEEVWTNEDFELLKMLCSNVYPFSHFFDHGIIGSGTCIFTKYRLKNANFHEFAMNLGLAQRAQEAAFHQPRGEQHQREAHVPENNHAQLRRRQVHRGRIELLPACRPRRARATDVRERCAP